jgi:hypothetical protein
MIKIQHIYVTIIVFIAFISIETYFCKILLKKCISINEEIASFRNTKNNYEKITSDFEKEVKKKTLFY